VNLLPEGKKRENPNALNAFLRSSCVRHAFFRFNIQRRTSKGRPTLTLPVMPLLRPWAPAADQDRINKMNKMPKPKDFIL